MFHRRFFLRKLLLLARADLDLRCLVLALTLEGVLRAAKVPLALGLLGQLRPAPLVLYRFGEVPAKRRHGVHVGAIVLLVGAGRPKLVIYGGLIIRLHGHVPLSEVGADEEAPVGRVQEVFHANRWIVAALRLVHQEGPHTVGL